jgi:hypothetical protein
MPVVSVDGLRFSGLAWPFKMLPSDMCHHMACQAMRQYILETNTWPLTRIKFSVGVTEKAGSGVDLSDMIWRDARFESWSKHPLS